ncbi:MAG TPA: hypothetical protein VKB75_09995 [Jatrophihabitans sp.]|nr:hypothetical protein [Jatrophihabitans sp.]
MASDRQANELADVIRAEDVEARRGQDRDAARIHRELVETDRLTEVIDDLLGPKPSAESALD